MRRPMLRTGKRRLRCNTENVETALLERIMQCLFESDLSFRLAAQTANLWKLGDPCDRLKSADALLHEANLGMVLGTSACGTFALFLSRLFERHATPQI